MFLNEKAYEKNLNIKTKVIRDWGSQYSAYNRTESTPYEVLDLLLSAYFFKPTDHFVDLGCGTGRATFFIHHFAKITVTGIEANEKTFIELKQNETNYKAKNQPLQTPLNLKWAFAEAYQFTKTANIFYFFNPFTIRIFKRVIGNILQSVKDYPRRVSLILYFPMPEFEEFILKNTSFFLFQEIKVASDKHPYGKICIYRLNNEEPIPA